jgi:NADH dehydrogenase (ubiquinone) 1 beta subcomplex subunit 10
MLFCGTEKRSERASEEASRAESAREQEARRREEEAAAAEEEEAEGAREMGFKGVKFEESAPEDFDPSEPYKDPMAFLEMREHIVREKWVAIERAKILRERVRQCYQNEGVNHLQNCRVAVRKYLESLKGVGWGKEGRPAYAHDPNSTWPDTPPPPPPSSRS